jgi:threonine/homoserine/homoserine lactone efflux protein
MVSGGQLLGFTLASLLQRSALVFVVVKLAGALYLMWLGVHARCSSA